MTLRGITSLAAIALLLAGAARAQSPSMMMPEGSKDRYVGVVVADAPSSEGSSSRQLVAGPTASGLWSNGVFARLGALGWHVTDDPTMDYGPILAYGFRSKRSDDAAHESRRDAQAGAFWSFMFTRETQFGSQLLHEAAARTTRECRSRSVPTRRTGSGRTTR